MSSTSVTYIKRFEDVIISMAKFAGGLGILSFTTVKELFKRPFYIRLTLDQLFLMGVQSLPLVIITALATGSVMTLQFSLGLEKFGGKMYIPRIVSLSFIREMGPVFTSLLVAGRIGSGMAAEVSSMKVTQQIDAIRALGTNPIKKIVVPRFIATMIALPCLTIIADFVGLFGGMLVAMQEASISASYYIGKCIETLRPVDFTTGLLKTVVFAAFISLSACYRGMRSEGGTKGVGDSTTFVVVSTNIFIMISDFFLTKLFMIILPYGQ